MIRLLRLIWPRPFYASQPLPLPTDVEQRLAERQRLWREAEREGLQVRCRRSIASLGLEDELLRERDQRHAAEP